MGLSEQTDQSRTDESHTTSVYTQGQALNEPHTYDIHAVEAFIDGIFEDVPDGAEPLFWAMKHNGKIGVPLQKGRDGLVRKMKDGKAHGMYFNVASFYPDPLGGLNHKHANFAALHLIVADDIGTKVDAQRFTDLNLTPSYIIESSPGNFQYGFVLDTPITDYDHACAAVQVFGCAGLTDDGGVQAGKIVRLPAGVNGKKDPAKEGFQVALVDNTGPVYTIKTLIERVGLIIEGDKFTWDSILAGDAPIARKQYSRFMNKPPAYFNTANMQDVVLEWLNDADMLVGDGGGDWVNITCPWGEFHTTGDDTAGYKPVGRGDDPMRRAFKCFHEHCNGNHTTEFLEYVLINSEFQELPMVEPAMRPHDFALYYPKNKVFDISGRPYDIDMMGFKTKYNKRVTVLRQKGADFKWEATTEAAYWLNSNYRIDVGGVRSDCAAKKVFDDDGVVCVNLFTPPKWIDGPYDAEKIKPFQEHLKFLLPDKREHDYMLQWCAAKMQNWAFRGTAIIMATPEYGIGRGSFSMMMSKLVGEHNTSPDLDFGEFIHGNFNAWLDNLLVLCSEADDTSDNNTNRYRAYEALKKRIDTGNTKILINPKGETQYYVKSASSTLIFSNHLDAIALAANDRRITVLRNPIRPKPPAYYLELREWQETDWPEHVYRWLRTIEVDLAALTLPLKTVGKDNMIEQNQPHLKRVFKLADDYFDKEGIKFISGPIMLNLAIAFGVNPDENKGFFRRCMEEISYAYTKSAQFRVRMGEVRMYPRIRNKVFLAREVNMEFLGTPMTAEDKNTASLDLHRINENDLRAYVADHID